MSIDLPAGRVPFTVTDQTHEEIPSQDGQMVGEWRVDFDTPSGVHSFVRVPDYEYNAQYVHSLISQKATEIEKVQAGPHA